MPLRRLPLRDPRTVARDIPGVLDVLFPRLTGGLVASLNRRMFSFSGIAPVADELIERSHLQKAMLFDPRLRTRQPASSEKEHVMRASPAAARKIIAVAALAAAAGLLAGCGSSPSPSAHPTATVTVTATAPSARGTSPPSPTQTATPAGPAGCATTALTASLGPASGAAGSSYYPIEFTNSSSATCSLYGYPGVSLSPLRAPRSV